MITSQAVEQAYAWNVEVQVNPTLSITANNNPIATHEAAQSSVTENISGSSVAINEEELTRCNSAPTQFNTKDWDRELTAPEEPAQRGCASQLLRLLKEKLQQEEFNDKGSGKANVINQYHPEPIGTPRIPPMPKGVPIVTFKRTPRIQMNTIRKIEDSPSTTGFNDQYYITIDLNTAGAQATVTSVGQPRAAYWPSEINFDRTGLNLAAQETITSTARNGFNDNTTIVYDKPIVSTGIKRPRNSTPKNIPSHTSKNMIRFAGQIIDGEVLRQQQIYPGDSRSLLRSNIQQERRCIGPALGVPVGKIPTNPWCAPQNEEQRQLFAAILSGKMKVGLLKATDGRVIMRRRGFVLLQPDKLGWRCGMCLLDHPRKYNQWDSWTGHGVHQVDILDEFSNGFIMICPDCDRNPNSPKLLDDCIEAIITCIRHWEDVGKGVIMEVLPPRQDCLCNRMPAKNLQR
ncbi:hypothetical protein QAD02_013489 [Eretmocerus hayati]|uniref:Uncharacterized protein n=1 Tax=Eretmocerus hayati TaxID=131215 RepID=A0ACC2P2U9_9HYME|nr:hypothetical protein QAD02_013489 [Eretmocerus hayati]